MNNNTEILNDLYNLYIINTDISNNDEFMEKLELLAMQNIELRPFIIETIQLMYDDLDLKIAINKLKIEICTKEQELEYRIKSYRDKLDKLFLNNCYYNN